MKVGFDIDGVLANFYVAYQEKMIEVTQRDLFRPGDDLDPPTWDWDTFRGYTKEEHRSTWDAIVGDRNFWFYLSSLPFAGSVGDISTKHHDVYFITNRVGVAVKRQTEHWLKTVLGVAIPTVLITSDQTGVDKGVIADALKLDAYVDDKAENVNQVVMHSDNTRTYLLNRCYNQPVDEAGVENHVDNRVIRINSLNTFFQNEHLR